MLFDYVSEHQKHPDKITCPLTDRCFNAKIWLWFRLSFGLESKMSNKLRYNNHLWHSIWKFNKHCLKRKFKNPWHCCDEAFWSTSKQSKIESCISSLAEVIRCPTSAKRTRIRSCFHRCRKQALFHRRTQSYRNKSPFRSRWAGILQCRCARTRLSNCCTHRRDLKSPCD